MSRSPVRESALRELRQQLGPRLDRLVEAFAQPTTQVYPSGYVGTVRRPIAELERALRRGGFHWDPISMYHYTPTGRPSDGSWVYRPSPLADRQLHVVLFAEGDDRTEVYAHDEYSWLRHPVKHAKHVDIRRSEGVDEALRWLDDRGVEYDRDGRVRRTLRHVVDQVRRCGADRGRLTR